MVSLHVLPVLSVQVIQA